MHLGRNQFSSDIPLILQALKKLLKAQGLRYQDVAETLEISRITVKRYLSGRGLTLAALESLCSVLGITLGDLIDIVRDNRPNSANSRSSQQEEALFAEPFLAILFVLLMRGWSPGQLQEEFDLTEVELTRYLTSLDRLKLIELHPFSRVKLLIGHPFNVAPGSPLLKAFDKYVKADLFKVNIMAPEVTFRYNYFKFSPGALQEFTKMMDDLLLATEQISATDRNLPKTAAKWQSVFVLVSPTNLKQVR